MEKDKIIFKNSIVMLLLFTFTNASKGLRNLTLSVYPEVIRRGQSAQLHCNYEVLDSSILLYSVKYYRGIFEFYRYTPFEHPPQKTFFFNTGIKVDLSVSNASHVTLRSVDFNLNGNISCEVTTESPTFYTATARNTLQVVELPHMPPTLWTEFTKYDPGDILRANCSTQPSKPSSSITFQLNQIAGDSGGPAESLNYGTLIGVVSFGGTCADPERPGVYAKVSAVRDWIREVAGV